jgi:hypothetical protein
MIMYRDANVCRIVKTEVLNFRQRKDGLEVTLYPLQRAL